MTNKNIIEQKIFRISATHPDFHLEKIIKNLPHNISLHRIIDEKYCYDLIANNSSDYNIFKDTISNNFKKIQNNLFIKLTNKDLYFNSPYFYISDNFNFNESLDNCIQSLKLKNEYISNLIKSNNELTSINKKELNNNLSILISSFYEIKIEESKKIINSVNRSVNNFFKKYPTVECDYFAINEINSQKDYIADKYVFEFSKILKQQIYNFNKNHDDKFIQKVIKNALKNVNIEELSLFKNINKQLINEGKFDELDDILLKKTKDTICKLPSIISTSRTEKFEFFNSYNILEREYSEITPVFKELLKILFAVKISEYQNSLFEKLDNLKKLEKDEFINEAKKINNFISNYNTNKKIKYEFFRS